MGATDEALRTLLLSPWAAALLGLCIGSFLNVVVLRLPVMLDRQWRHDCALAEGRTTQAEAPFNLVTPRSRCGACGHVLAWWENIPALSYLWLRGRCSACGVRYGIRYPLVEIATGVLFAGVAWRLGAQWSTLAWLAVTAALIALALIDWDTTLLPDDITLPLLWAGMIAAALGWTIPLATAVWGAVAGYLSLWLVYWGFKLLTGKEGMGYGDFKLLAALGAWFGWPLLLPILIASSVVGAVVGIGLKLTGGLREGRYVPFGPFLAGAALLILLIGPDTVARWAGP